MPLILRHEIRRSDLIPAAYRTPSFGGAPAGGTDLVRQMVLAAPQDARPVASLPLPKIGEVAFFPVPLKRKGTAFCRLVTSLNRTLAWRAPLTFP